MTWGRTIVGALALLGALLAAPVTAAPPADLSECGLDDPTAPDFSLVDRNPASPTVGTTWTRADFAGRVMVIYWATAT